jgi:hypothetical protein
MDIQDSSRTRLSHSPEYVAQQILIASPPFFRKMGGWNSAPEQWE